MLLVFIGAGISWVITFFATDNAGAAYFVAAGVMCLAWPRNTEAEQTEAARKEAVRMLVEAQAEAAQVPWWRR